jgi:hypothetical protein
MRESVLCAFRLRAETGHSHDGSAQRLRDEVSELLGRSATFLAEPNHRLWAEHTATFRLCLNVRGARGAANKLDTRCSNRQTSFTGGTVGFTNIARHL